MKKLTPLSSSASPRGRVRMRDVALRAGVSVSTVSLVLSGDSRIPEDTVRKVLQTVKAMEYRPNIIARNLARKGSRTIGVILPEHAFEHNQSFYYQVLHGIHSQTQPAGFKIVVEAANKIFLERRYYHRLLKEQSADGIIYMAAGLSDVFLSDMSREPTPFVLLAASVDQTNLPVVKSDDEKAVDLAVRHLVSLGHQQIGYIGSDITQSRGRDRHNSFKVCLEKSGGVFDPQSVVKGDFGQSEAKDAVLSLLSSKSLTAIVAGSDPMAYAVLRACWELKRRVPEDLALVGMDDLTLSACTTPSLTTVRTHVFELGGIAARFVLKNLKNPQANKSLVGTIPLPELVIRESCGAKK